LVLPESPGQTISPATIALTRPVPSSLAACELTHVARVPIDVAKARAQHREYEQALASLGCDVRHVQAADRLPDSVFVEDTAIVLDEIAVVTRPGAVSRWDETAGVAEALADYRQLRFLREPATLDGGDVLRLGRTLYVGVGGRTNEPGARQLAELVEPHGYEIRRVAVSGCLHLKSAVTLLADGLVLVNPSWIDPGLLAGQQAIEVHPEEPFAANVLRIGGTVLCASSYDRTGARLDDAGLAVRAVDVSELAKAEGAVTCCSLVFLARS
jgi:dimethylargininase